MRSLTRVKVISIVLITLICALSIAFYVVLSKIEDTQYKAEKANELVFELFERRLLTDEYLYIESERIRNQWLSKHETLTTLVAEYREVLTSADDQQHLGAVAATLPESREIFEKIVSYREAASSDDQVFDANINHLAIQLMLQSQAGLTAASRIAEANTTKSNDLLDAIRILYFAASLLIIPALLVGAWIVLRAVRSAEEIEQQKTQFLSIASHQLRTPLGAMRWSLEYILEEENSKLSPEAREQLQSVYDSDVRLIALVGDLLNVTRIEAGHTKSEPANTDITPILESALSEMEVEAAKRGVTLEKEIPSVVPQVFVGAQSLREVTQNLLSNAVKYTPKGGRVTLRAKVTKKEVIVEVVDTGAGIPKADQKKLFNKFFRAENAVKLDPDGNGLGLFIVKAYVEEWGGKLSFVSEENKGSTFTYTVPVQET